LWRGALQCQNFFLLLEDDRLDKTQVAEMRRCAVFYKSEFDVERCSCSIMQMMLHFMRFKNYSHKSVLTPIAHVWRPGIGGTHVAQDTNQLP
jgi:hypothetical protein